MRQIRAAGVLRRWCDATRARHRRELVLFRSVVWNAALTLLRTDVSLASRSSRQDWLVQLGSPRGAARLPGGRDLGARSAGVRRQAQHRGLEAVNLSEDTGMDRVGMAALCHPRQVAPGELL